ncbi:Wadjet anti-phage system protein JetD domain-containing protein [Vibrio breoganii]
MAKLIRCSEIKQKLEKRWQGLVWHDEYLSGGAQSPIVIKLPKVTDKQLLHEFVSVQSWLNDLTALEKHQGINIERQAFRYKSMGMQVMPVAIYFSDIESLARYLGKRKQWQAFIATFEQVVTALPQLKPWVRGNLSLLLKHQESWPKLIGVCRYFIDNPQPNCYIRQLDIDGVDTKFIERHKSIIRTLLDEVLAPELINQRFNKLSEHGFERRFNLLYDQPVIRFRLLDSQFTHEFHGMSDLSLPLEQFAQLSLMVDRVYITENKINGLAFPAVNNAIVIFGLGYGVQSLSQVRWLNECQIYYWGDIDTHGYAILSQLRGYFPKTQSLLMDEDTLMSCKSAWGKEGKVHPSDRLANLTEAEHHIYTRLKQDHWRNNLRLEQELIPMSYLYDALKLHSFHL